LQAPDDCPQIFQFGKEMAPLRWSGRAIERHDQPRDVASQLLCQLGKPGISILVLVH
jgi:hypothetical protein